MYNLSTSEEVKMGLKSVISDKIKELGYDTRSLNEIYRVILLTPSIYM